MRADKKKKGTGSLSFIRGYLLTHEYITMYMLQKVLLITGGYLHPCKSVSPKKKKKMRFGARVKNYKNYKPYPQKLTKLYCKLPT